MKEWLLDHLVCPRTGARLDLKEARMEGLDIVAGTLVSATGESYPIRDGVPYLGVETISPAERQTVHAFGQEWRLFPDFDGHMESAELFFQFFPALSPGDFQGRTALDAGCGNGRWLRRIAEFGCKKLIGLDYSEAVHVSHANTKALPNVTVVQGSILAPPFVRQSMDLVVSMGVVHHLVDPAQGLAALGRLLRPSGGRLAVWVYGYEGNEIYLRIVEPLRRAGPHLGPGMLLWLSRALAVPVWIHAHTVNRWAAWRRDGRFHLPMAAYFDMLTKLRFNDIVSIVYDQLTPTLARYYRRDEVEALVSAAGLELLSCEQPRGNSYSVLGKIRPEGAL